MVLVVYLLVQWFQGLRDKAAAKKEYAHCALMKDLAAAAPLPLDEAILILEGAGLSYGYYDQYGRPSSYRWKIPKAFFSSKEGASEKAKALNSVIVKGRRYGGDNQPEIDLHNILMLQAKKTPLVVIMISCMLVRVNQDFKRWFCQD